MAKKWFYIVEDGNKERAIIKELLVSAYGEFLNQIFWNQDKEITIDLIGEDGNKYYSWVNGKLINHDIFAENEIEVLRQRRERI